MLKILNGRITVSSVRYDSGIIRTSIVFIIIFFCIFLIITPVNHLDFYTHNKQLLAFYKSGYWRPNFLYYLILAVFTGFSKNMHALAIAASVIMACSIYSKWLLTKKMTVEFHGELLKEGQYKILEIFSFLLLFVFSLPANYNNWYFGQVSPNQWHNSTTILLMPFALLLFRQTYILISENDKSVIFSVILLSILNVLIKPSFFFCLVPVAFIFSFILCGNWKEMLKNMLIFSPAIIIVLFQYLILYNNDWQSSNNLSGEDGGVTINFLHVWGHYSNHILWSLFLSLAFPLVFLLFYWKQAIVEKQFLFSASLLFTALIMFAFLTETGTRQFHCNFIWQAIVCNYIFYWVCINIFLKDSFSKYSYSQKTNRSINVTYTFWKNINWQDRLIISVFILQSMGGIYYLLRMLLRNGSYA